VSALVAAVVSSVFDREVPADAVFVGEVGLGGELRPVGQIERRLAEAARMGFGRAYVARRGVPAEASAGLETVPVADVRTLLDLLFR